MSEWASKLTNEWMNLFKINKQKTFQLGDEEAMSAEEVDEEQNNGVENSQELTHHANYYQQSEIKCQWCN